MKLLKITAVLVSLSTLFDTIKGGTRGLYQGGVTKVIEDSQIVFDDIPIEAVKAITDSITTKHSVLSTDESENNITYLFESLLDNNKAPNTRTTISEHTASTLKPITKTTYSTTSTSKTSATGKTTTSSLLFYRPVIVIDS